MHTLSVKELRLKFPLIRSELKKGEEFLLIHKSKPIAIIKPVDDIPELDEPDEEFEATTIEDANIDDDYLTEEEIAHYMSL